MEFDRFESSLFLLLYIVTKKYNFLFYLKINGVTLQICQFKFVNIEG